MTQSSQASSRRLGCTGMIVLIVLILALLGGFIFYHLEIVTGRLVGTSADALRGLADKTRNAFVAVTQLQPQVTVNEQVIFTQSSPVMELAVINQQTVVEREAATTWLGSTKRLRLRGVYNVKAGFDLQQPFSVHLDKEHPGKVAVEMPPARILSVEQQKLDVLTLEDGIWNHVKAGDLTSEINELNLDARGKAWHAGILDKAQRTLTDGLKEKIGPEYEVEVTTLSGTPLSAGQPASTVTPRP